MSEKCKSAIDTAALCLVLLVILLATGCATDPATLKMALDAQTQGKATLRVTCPAGGCEVEYTDPRDRAQIRLPSNGYDAYMATIGAVKDFATAAIVPAAMGVVAVKGFDALKGSGAITTNATTTTNTTSTANSGNTQTSTVGANSGANSGNSGRLAGGDVTDSTHAPTIVTQPVPVIVTQPPPVIVTP